MDVYRSSAAENLHHSAAEKVIQMPHDMSRYGFREKKSHARKPVRHNRSVKAAAKELYGDAKDLAKAAGTNVARFGRKVVKRLNTKVAFVGGDMSNLEKYRKLKSAGWKRMANKTWKSPKGKTYSNMQAAYRDYR